MAWPLFALAISSFSVEAPDFGPITSSVGTAPTSITGSKLFTGS